MDDADRGIKSMLQIRPIGREFMFSARMKSFTLAIALVLGALTADASPAWTQGNTKAAVARIGPSGLRVPRFVSLKSGRVNVRKGPSLDHPVAWEFKRLGLPVEVIAEFENWRQVRDSENSEGWVFHSLLSGRRTALVAPWLEAGTAIPLYVRSSTNGAVVAQLEPGVLGSLLSCDGQWCNFSLDSVSGWIQQVKLWGVYEDEKIK